MIVWSEIWGIIEELVESCKQFSVIGGVKSIMLNYRFNVKLQTFSLGDVAWIHFSHLMFSDLQDRLDVLRLKTVVEFMFQLEKIWTLFLVHIF